MPQRVRAKLPPSKYPKWLNERLTKAIETVLQTTIEVGHLSLSTNEGRDGRKLKDARDLLRVVHSLIDDVRGD